MWQSVKNIYHLCVAFFANIWFGFPSKKITVIGVTGTDGKTTTVSLIYHILQAAEQHVSLISSIGALINGKDFDTGFHVTTPSSFTLQRFLKKVLEKVQKKNYMILEVTSHAIDQNRIYGIDFAVAVLTNITHEHLDYHRTYQNYVKTKAKFLQKSKTSVLNKDDESYLLIKPHVNSKVITYGMGTDADVNPHIFPFKADLIGKFNTYNCLAAIAVCKTLQIEDEVIKSAIKSFKLPIGRAEIVYKDAFTVMVDFAHTPNALHALLSSIKPNVKGRLIHVFGSAGERDYQKRPEMGRISSEFSDVIILTAEDPRSESAEKIIHDIESGIRNQESWEEKELLFKISDRKEAIRKAVQMAKKGDFIIITGKGHEKSMNLGHGDIPWSDQEVIKDALMKLIRNF